MQTERLNESLRRISAVKDTLDLSEVLSTTVEQLGLTMSTDRCYICMVKGPGTTTLGPIEHEWSGPDLEPLAGSDIPLPIASLAGSSGTTQWSEDVTADPRLKGTGAVELAGEAILDGSRAVLSAPLSSGDELLGVVTVTAREARSWSNDDITLIELAAHEVAGAIHHALMYEEATETIRELRELEERRADYISMVSHEIRSPMTVVAGIADILQNKRHRLSDEAIQDLVESLGREARRLARFVSEILDLERIDRGGMQLIKHRVDLLDLVREAIEDTGEASRIEMDANIDSATLDLDSDKIKQVLINLISNAAKFAPDRSDIKIEVHGDREKVMVAVHDNGPGISEADKDRLFQRFSRLESTAVKPGSGMGLYLSRLIIERHAGTIWAESELGSGTSFFFSLPR